MLDIDHVYLQSIEEAAVKFAREAGDMLLNYFGTDLDIEYKSENRRDPVTQADKNIEKHIRESILKSFPDHGVVGEEFDNTTHDSPEYVWIIDPLDGTNNFVNGLQVFSCSIAVVFQGIPVVAAVFLPWRDSGSIIHARIGNGTFENDRRLKLVGGESPQRGRLSGLPSYYWAMFGFRNGLRRQIGEIRSLGSVVYELALTARGSMQISLFYSPKIWDVAAGVLLVKEAGGDVRVRTQTTHGWEPFISFGSGTTTLQELYDWRGTILAGDQNITQYVSRRLIYRRRLLFRLIRWLKDKRGNDR
jgi:myo-inositol-1(or 4)-monophosphatase